MDDGAPMSYSMTWVETGLLHSYTKMTSNYDNVYHISRGLYRKILRFHDFHTVHDSPFNDGTGISLIVDGMYTRVDKSRLRLVVILSGLNCLSAGGYFCGVSRSLSRALAIACMACSLGW